MVVQGRADGSRRCHRAHDGEPVPPRLGGLLAGLPVITAPALFWLVHEQGADFAALGLACAAGLPRCMPARVAG